MAASFPPQTRAGVNYWGEMLPAGRSSSRVEEEGGDETTGAEALFLTASYEGGLVLGARVPMQGVCVSGKQGVIR